MDKKYFLKRDEDFKKVYRNRKTYGNRNFTLYVLKTNTDLVRMGFSINKKVGKAVERNLIKRRLRALYSDNYQRIKPGYDLVLVVKPNVNKMNYKQLRSAFIHILKVSKLWKKRKG